MITDELFNREKTLELALYVTTSFDPESEDPVKKLADEFIIIYIVDELLTEDGSFTETQVYEKYKEYCAQYIIKSLEKQNLVDTLVDEDGKIYYSLNENGKDFLEDYINEK